MCWEVGGFGVGDGGLTNWHWLGDHSLEKDESRTTRRVLGMILRRIALGVN